MRLPANAVMVAISLIAASCSFPVPPDVAFDADPRDAIPIDAGVPGIDGSVDANRPGVVVTTPAEASTDAEPGGTVSATFSTDMNPSTIDTSTFILVSDGSAVPGAVSYDVGTRTAVFAPEARLSLLGDYSATISATVADLADVAIGADHAWSFDVREGVWAAPGLIETNATTANSPQVAFDISGNAVAVWQQYDGGQENIWANRYLSTTGWGTATLIESNTGRAAGPQVALDDAGNAIAVWYQSDGTRDNIWANRYQVGVGWGTAALIEFDDVYGADSPQLALDAAGNAFSIWCQSDGVRRNVMVNRYVAGAGWGTAAQIESINETAALDPAEIAVDAAGNAIAIWLFYDGTRNNVWANRYVAGFGWGTATVIESNNLGSAYGPKVALDSTGNAVAVWMQSDGSLNHAWANRYVVGSGWGAATLIETNDSGGVLYPQVAVDPAGNAHAVWHQSDGTRNNVWANRYQVGAGWGLAALLETDNAGAASGEAVAVDPAGNAIVVWQQSDGSTVNVWANRYVNGVGWGDATLIETDNNLGVSSPQISINRQGSGMSVWSQSSNVWAASFR